MANNKCKFWALSVSHTETSVQNTTCWWLHILFFSAGSPTQLLLLQMSSSQSKMTVGINFHSCAPYCPKSIIFNCRGVLFRQLYLCWLCFRCSSDVRTDWLISPGSGVTTRSALATWRMNSGSVRRREIHLNYRQSG